MKNALRKYTVTCGLIFTILASVVIFSDDASAQCRRRGNSFNGNSKTRTAITIGGGTLAGAGVGGLIGGRKGAVIGAVTGAGASTLFEFVRRRNRDRDRRF
jgi:uncharacterized membrane protein